MSDNESILNTVGTGTSRAEGPRAETLDTGNPSPHRGYPDALNLNPNGPRYVLLLRVISPTVGVY